MSILDLLHIPDNSSSPTFFGVVSGVVVENQDPDNLGRVKVKIPRFSDSEMSHWARVTTFMGGNERGGFFLPEVGDEVLIAFECGDLNMPYVIGSLWNGKEVPPETNSDGKNNIRCIKSRSGHLISLDDTEGAEVITIIDKSEKNSIIIDTAKNSITIACDGDLTFTAQKGKITLEGQDIVLKASASIKEESSSQTDIKSSGPIKVQGATIDLN